MTITDFSKYRHLIHDNDDNNASKISDLDKPVYGMPFSIGGLGDYWAYTNYFLKLSESCGDTVHIKCSDYSIKYIKECKNFIQSTGSLVFTDMPPTKIIFWSTAFKETLPATKIWNPIGTKVAFQFDGICDGNLKNPSASQVESFLKRIKTLKTLSLEPIDVGHKKKLDYCIKTMAESNCLVSCPSGMSIIAKSINVPIYIVYNNLPIEKVESLKTIQYTGYSKIWWFKTFEEMFAFWLRIPLL